MDSEITVTKGFSKLLLDKDLEGHVFDFLDTLKMDLQEEFPQITFHFTTIGSDSNWTCTGNITEVERTKILADCDLLSNAELLNFKMKVHRSQGTLAQFLLSDGH